MLEPDHDEQRLEKHESSIFLTTNVNHNKSRNKPESITAQSLGTKENEASIRYNNHNDESSLETVYDEHTTSFILQQQRQQEQPAPDEYELHQTREEQEQQTAVSSDPKKQAKYKERFKSKLPTFMQIRKTLKGAIALLLATIMALNRQTREAIGTSVLLVPITMVFYFPVRAVGVQIEAVLYGTFGALLSAAWSILGTFLANLAKDHTIATGIQPGVCAILGVFLFIGTFVIMYVRRRYHNKANFACVNACNLLVFTMTESAVMNRFDAEFTWSYLKPIALAGALAIAVDVFLWPDDSFSKYITVLEKTIKGYNAYFKENSETFISSAANDTTRKPIASLPSRLKGNVLLLIDCKRAAQREILYTKVSARDLSEQTRIIKTMRTPLHGIGLSVQLRRGLSEKGRTNPFLHDVDDMDTFTQALAVIRNEAQQLTNACHSALNVCLNRVKTFHGGERSVWSNILWPFPRLFAISRDNTAKDRNDISNVHQHLLQCLESWNARSTQGLKVFISKQHHRNKSHYQYCSPERIPEYGPLHLVALYEYSLGVYATNVVALLQFVGERDRTCHDNRRLRPPCTSARKWFRAEDLDPIVGDDPMDDLQRPSTLQSEASQGIIGSITNSEEQEFQDPGDCCGFWRARATGKMHYRDPDVKAPRTKCEWAFYELHRVQHWLSQHEPFMALKTATGVVLLGIPAWRVDTAQFYYDWRGQWALITMVLWMFPTTGRFVFLLIMRFCGSIFGCIAGIIIWEISRGNPYGIAALSFAFFVPLYYVFFFKPLYKVATFLAKVTLLLVVVYEYNYVEWGRASNDPVYIVAGKRVAMIFLGLISSTILSMIPYPVTGRVELRKKLARTIRDIGRLYGILVASYIIKPGRGAMPTETQIKRFRKLTSQLRRQISDERNLLEHAVYEPPLRGKFPLSEYKVIIEKVDSMADLVHAMGRSVLYINPEWKQVIASTLMHDRRDYLAAIMTTIKLISATLAAKTTLPPYMIQPHDVRARFTADIEKKLHIGPREIMDQTFTRYCTYMVTSSAFVNELQDLLNTVKQLVGVEDPDEWLYLHF